MSSRYAGIRQRMGTYMPNYDSNKVQPIIEISFYIFFGVLLIWGGSLLISTNKLLEMTHQDKEMNTWIGSIEIVAGCVSIFYAVYKIIA